MSSLRLSMSKCQIYDWDVWERGDSHILKPVLLSNHECGIGFLRYSRKAAMLTFAKVTNSSYREIYKKHDFF